MTELHPGKLARPMDRNAMSNDMGILKNLLGMLNNPAITGAQPPADAVAVVTEPIPAPSPPIQEPPPVIAPPKSIPVVTNAFRLASRRLFLTGASKAGKSWVAAQLGARIMELMDPVNAMIVDCFPNAREESVGSLRNEIFAWGCGHVTKGYPLTASRMHFVQSVRGMPNKAGLFGVDLDQFGTATFWTDSLIARATSFQQEFPKELLVVTDVWTFEDYKALREAGFTPFHVLCNNITRSGRGGTSVANPLVTSIERDITQRVSQEPRGRKLLAVWSDQNYPPTSGRLFTVQEFVEGVTRS